MIKFSTIRKNINEIDLSNIFNDFCFGQKCEDYLVNLIFKSKTEGIYIDIGAHDGVRFSNTFGFSKLGWRGICVEAHPDYYNICCNNRKSDSTKIYNVACSNIDSANITFYSNYRGSLSTLNPNLNEYYKTHYRGYYIDKNFSNKVAGFTNGPILIEGKKLDTIIENNKDFFQTVEIDLISIDVDGSEDFVLRGFDILKYKPRIIIFEVSVVRSVVEDYMSDKNYIKLYDNDLNAIYCRDKEDATLFYNELEKNKHKLIISYDTSHPLGN